MNFCTTQGKKSRFARKVLPIVLLLISHGAAQSDTIIIPPPLPTIGSDQIRDYFFYQQGFAPWGINSNTTSVGLEINLFSSLVGATASFTAEAPFASQTTVTATVTPTGGGGGGATINIPYWNAPAQPTNFSSLPLPAGSTQPFTITVSNPGFQTATFQTNGLKNLPTNFPSVAFITNVATSDFSTHPTISWLQPAVTVPDGFTAVTQVRIFDLNNNNSEIYFANNLPLTTTSLAIPIVPTGNNLSLADHGKYVIDVEVKLLSSDPTSNSTNNRIGSFTQSFIPFSPNSSQQVTTGGSIFLPSISATGTGQNVYNFNVNVTPGTAYNIDPSVALGYI
jgi:hypothetical protein